MATQEASAEEGLGLDPPSGKPPRPLAEAAAPSEAFAELPVQDKPGDLVTVLVPARNEERAIGPCLDSILAQDETNLQVLVVDGGSSDATREIVREYAHRDPRVQLLTSPGETISSSLNTGLRAASGRWLVRVDAHSTIPPGYVAGLVEHLRTGQWGGVGGRKHGVAASATGRAIAAAMSSRFGVGNSVYHHGTSVRHVDHVPFGAYPTALLQGLSGWDERIEANEDFELDYRIRKQGHRLLFDPAVSIAWESRQTPGELFRQYRRYGRGKARVAMMHPRSVKPRHLAAPALVASWVLAAVLAFRWPWLLALAAIPYAAALLLAFLVTARGLSGWRARRALPAAFVVMHVGWGLGFWGGVVAEAVDRVRGRFRR